jgi:hypothetical protein
MRTTRRIWIASLLAVAVIVLATVSALAADPTPSSPVAAEDTGDGAVQPGGPMTLCTKDHPDCNDMAFGSGGGDAGAGATCLAGTTCDDTGIGTGSSEPGSAGGEPVPAPVPPSDGSGGGGTCGEVVEGDGPDGTVSYTPCDDPGTPVPPEPAIVEPTPGMNDVHPLRFDTATVGDDDVTVTIDFVSGIEPCYVLDHVGVDYGKDTVTITLFEGSDVSGGQVACIDIAQFKRTIVTLDEPLAGRTIVDGAA